MSASSTKKEEKKYAKGIYNLINLDVYITSWKTAGLVWVRLWEAVKPRGRVVANLEHEDPNTTTGGKQVVCTIPDIKM